jgi:hypothetical protein
MDVVLVVASYRWDLPRVRARLAYVCCSVALVQPNCNDRNVLRQDLTAPHQPLFRVRRLRLAWLVWLMTGASLFGEKSTAGWLRLVASGWFVLREKYCWLVADNPSEPVPTGTTPRRPRTK